MNKNYKTFIGFAIAIFGLGALIWFSRLPEQNEIPFPAEASVGRLDAQELAYDFGSVSMAAGKVKHEFKVTNAASSPVKITKIYTSCMCTTATIKKGEFSFGPFGMPGHGVNFGLNQVVNPGEEIVIVAEFDPAAHGPAGVGPIERAVRVEIENGEPLEFEFKAIVTP